MGKNKIRICDVFDYFLDQTGKPSHYIMVNSKYDDDTGVNQTEKYKVEEFSNIYDLLRKYAEYEYLGVDFYIVKNEPYFNILVDCD